MMNKDIEKKFDEAYYVQFSDGKRTAIEHASSIKAFITTHYIARSDLEEAIEEMIVSGDGISTVYVQGWDKALQDLKDKLL